MRQDFAKPYRSGYSGMPAEKLLSFLKLPLDKCSLMTTKLVESPVCRILCLNFLVLVYSHYTDIMNPKKLG